MARLHFVKKARKNYPEASIKKGDSYYWWKFNYERGRHMSLVRPKPSALTRSAHLGAIYDLQDTLDFSDRSATEESVLAAMDTLTDLSEQAQESLDAMPEHCQDSSSSGELLQEPQRSLKKAISKMRMSISRRWMNTPKNSNRFRKWWKALYLMRVSDEN